MEHPIIDGFGRLTYTYTDSEHRRFRHIHNAVIYISDLKTLGIQNQTAWKFGVNV
jgi:hypothetical protein